MKKYSNASKLVLALIITLGAYEANASALSPCQLLTGHWSTTMMVGDGSHTKLEYVNINVTSVQNQGFGNYYLLGTLGNLSLSPGSICSEGSNGTFPLLIFQGTNATEDAQINILSGDVRSLNVAAGDAYFIGADGDIWGNTGEATLRLTP